MRNSEVASSPTISNSPNSPEKEEKEEILKEELDPETIEEENEKIEVPSSLHVVPDKEMKPTSKNCFRLVILGASKVGKTSIVSR